MFLPFMVRAQDPQFTQYYATPAFLNPALSGMEKDVYFGLSYRSQWKNLGIPYETYQFTMMHPIFTQGSENTQTGGVGLTVFQDKAGETNTFKTTGVLITAGYNLRIDRSNMNIISFGVQAGVIQKRIDISNLQWGSQYNALFGYDQYIDPTLELEEDGRSFPVVNAGLVYYFNPYKNYYINKFSGFLGGSIAYLNRPDESIILNRVETLPSLIKLHGGMEYKLSSNFFLSPSFLFMSQATFSQYNMGIYGTYQLSHFTRGSKFKPTHVTFGGWYRIGDAYIFSFGLATKTISFGLSYDMNSSTLGNAASNLGAYELSVFYRINKGKGIKRFSTPLL